MIMCAAINGTWFGPRIAKVEREGGPERAECHAQKAPGVRPALLRGNG